MSQLQIPELRLPIPESPRILPGGLHLHNMQNSGGVGSGPPLLLVPPSGGGVPRRRHSWICRQVGKMIHYRLFSLSYYANIHLFLNCITQKPRKEIPSPHPHQVVTLPPPLHVPTFPFICNGNGDGDYRVIIFVNLQLFSLVDICKRGWRGTDPCAEGTKPLTSSFPPSMGLLSVTSVQMPVFTADGLVCSVASICYVIATSESFPLNIKLSSSAFSRGI